MLIRMRSGLAALALALPVALLACGPADAGRRGDTVGEGRTFTLAPGGTARLEGADLAVTFTRVSQDSRCPRGVQCVWEGDVTVDVEAVTGGKATAHRLNLNREPTGVTVAGHDLRLVAIRPDRVAGRPVPAGDYRADFTLTRR
ncbi:hypothetical protein ACSNOI_29375 [Actinomadura kijaniata]|uniref:hypothetical protein n=1 Tax=Actinomadura kijaniata TaxID=46161 RepID=UPI003F1B1877